MMTHIQIAAPNSVILVMDRMSGEIPEHMGPLVAATQSCIAVGTRNSLDGLTKIILTDEVNGHSCCEHLAFDGIIQTPTRHISVFTVYNEMILDIEVPSTSTRVQIWSNDSVEPNVLQIAAVKAS